MCKEVKDALFNLMHAMAKQYTKEHPEDRDFMIYCHMDNTDIDYIFGEEVER